VVFGLAQNIKQPPKTRPTNRNRNWGSRVLDDHSTGQSFGGAHGDSSDYVIPEMRGHLRRQDRSLILNAIAGVREINFERVKNPWKFSRRKLHIEHRTNDLHDSASIHAILLAPDCSPLALCLAH
jgi:hypothetical protein